ncbi:MAG: leucine-rich repeat domain-containing protein [Candidatus Fimimorpha sp.]
MDKQQLDFEYESKDNQITIKKYIGAGHRISVPEQIDGKEVIKIAPFAFAQQRQLEEVILPDTLQILGAHAFYDCRKLKKICFGVQLNDIEDGAFKNCYELDTLVLKGNQKRMRGMKYILSEFDSEIEVILDENKLLFPSYAFDYQENTMARTIHQDILGAGFSYRSTVFADGVDYHEYDSLFYKVEADSVVQSVRLAWYRLRYPYQLSSKAKTIYEAFLSEHNCEAVNYFLDREQWEGIRMLTERQLISQEQISAAIEAAQKKEKMPAVSILMEYQSHFQIIEEKDFEL